MLKACISFIVTVFLLCLMTETASADWSIDFESGIAFSGYNDVRIPGNTGTDLSLSQDLEARSTEFVRLRFALDLSDQQHLSFFIAPLRFESSGTLNRNVDFNGVRFNSGVPLNALYRFDSYRVTYQYTWLKKDRIRAGIGFTGKVRDASIRIDNGTVLS